MILAQAVSIDEEEFETDSLLPVSKVLLAGNAGTLPSNVEAQQDLDVDYRSICPTLLI